MPFQPALKLWILICTALPSVLARRGGGGGKGGADLGDSTSGLSLAPIPAAGFAFYVIFAIFNAFQTLQAIGNISRRYSQRPPSITLPEFSVGPIFPTSLLLSALILTILNILSAIDVALRNNQGVLPFDRPELSQSYFSAVRVLGYLADVLLVIGALAVLAHREKVLVTTPALIRGIKMVFDAVLTATLLALSMAVVGLEAAPLSRAALRTEENVYLAYHAFFLVAMVDILVSSIVLHFRARGSPVNDHKITFRIALIVSPFFILYALYAFIIWHIKISTFDAEQQLALAGTIVDCVIPFIIIATYLGFGMPPVPKQKKGVQES